ncbi:hypothetical protein QBC38DRAFT_269797 [Podospora fimiseda]|uniref:Uncharacterized protein n=1 Tax=Podospora fimiseda TaxID=252190 RepID=A0AAN7BL63_9PEZI|nr:hypothetical protein QBC38DRAFT_269797 [Podospora fimiseda]
MQEQNTHERLDPFPISQKVSSFLQSSHKSPHFFLLNSSTTMTTKTPTSEQGVSFPLTKEGLVVDIKPYTGLSYQATNYEPICGSLGTNQTLFSKARNIDSKCASSLTSFLDNATTDNVAIYDPATGKHLSTGRVGAGVETCLCFALSGVGTNKNVDGGLCLWSDADGKGLQYGINGDSAVKALGLVGSYGLVENNRSLPSCSLSDVSKLKASWSATALAVPSATGVVSLNGTGNGTETDAGGSKTGVIAGGTGGGALLIIVMLVLFCCCAGGDGKKAKYKTSAFDIHDGRWLGVPTRQRV